MLELSTRQEGIGELLFLLHIGSAVFCGWIARRKHRSFFGFFLISLLLTPLAGILAALLAKPGQARSEASPMVSSRAPDTGTVEPPPVFEYEIPTSDMKYVVGYQNLGEFKMGCDGYGFAIMDRDRNVLVDAFASVRFNVNVPRPNMELFKYDDDIEVFLMLGNYMSEEVFIKPARKLICPYKVATDGLGEKVIFGSQEEHYRFLGGHVYLQVPWIHNDSYRSIMKVYYALRHKQVAELRKALPNQAL
ncbi:MAG TPA: hypothetical protein VI078_01050 [bacterium]